MRIHVSLAVALLAFSLFACDRREPTTAVPPPEEVAAVAWLTPITDPSQVCMVTNVWMGRPQIPVVVDSKTYFGCCEACKAKLDGDPTARTARDPVTGEPVDKAVAVMARDDGGAIYYFASDDNLRRYRRTP